MPTNVKVKDLKINKLTEAQYDAAVQAGTIGENELSILTDVVEKTIQVDTLPTASAEEEGKIYQYVGEDTALLKNGYFYKCVAGSTPDSFIKVRDVSYDPEYPTYWELSITNWDNFKNTYCKKNGQVVASLLYFGIGSGDSDVAYNYDTETAFVPSYDVNVDGVNIDEISYSAGTIDYQGDGVLYQFTPAVNNGYIWQQIDTQSINKFNYSVEMVFNPDDGHSVALVKFTG